MYEEKAAVSLSSQYGWPLWFAHGLRSGCLKGGSIFRCYHLMDLVENNIQFSKIDYYISMKCNKKHSTLFKVQYMAKVMFCVGLYCHCRGNSPNIIN